MIDLLKFIGKKVEIELRNGNVYSGHTVWEDLMYSGPIYKYSIDPLSCRYDRYGNYGKLCNDLDIIKIEEIKPLIIDLSQFVGKEVKVTYRGNGTGKGYITKKKTGYGGTHPYKFNSFGYDQWGNFYGPKSNHHLDIIKIEEIKPMNKYEELEKKVAEMQKEIDRLKKEEIVHPKIKSVRVTRTIEYSPECYLDYCRETEVSPSQNDFIAYLNECLYHDFLRVAIFEQTIEEIDE